MTTRTPKTPSSSDRFIASRSTLNLDLSNHYLMNDSPNYKKKVSSYATASKDYYSIDSNVIKEDYSKILAETLFEGEDYSRILSFSDKSGKQKTCSSCGQCHCSTQCSNFTSFSYLSSPSFNYLNNQQSRRRQIPSAPERILDAPEFIDDYYLNLLDWSSDNILAIALGSSVYLWNAGNGSISELVSLGSSNDHVCSISWAEEGRYLGVGTNNGEVKIYDAHAERLVRTMRGHRARVSCLSWNNQILSAGGRDQSIINFDVSVQNPVVHTMKGHEQEVCGLKWNPQKSILASGGNDNLLLLWDNRRPETPLFSFDRHQAAVKALAWNPHQANLLASGGGTADRHIRFWNTQSGLCIGEHDTKSQVCSIIWSKTYKNELISSHGFSHNQLIVWEYPRMTKLAELTGHTHRVLQLAMSPDGETVASAAADETLRLWKAFEKNPHKASSSSMKKKLFKNKCTIR